jgi:hypothetical protein
MLRPSRKSHSDADREVLIADDSSSSSSVTLVGSLTEAKCTTVKVIVYSCAILVDGLLIRFK